MSIDLKQFATAEVDGEWLDILHPVTGSIIRDEAGEAMQLRLVGKDSKQYRAAQRAVTERRLKSRSKSSRVSAEGIEQEAIEVLIACVTDWIGVGEEGEVLECNPINVRKVLSDYQWLKEQVDEFVDDRGNFMKS